MHRNGCARCATPGARFSPVSETKTVRIRDGEVLLGDGPVAEATVQIASFNILECADLDEAVEVASKNPGATFGILELRPFVES